MPAGLTMLGVPSSVMPTKPTGTPSTNRMLNGSRSGRPVPLVDHVGGEVREVGAAEPVAVLAAVDRVAAAELQALELVGALVELVVADRADLQAERVEHLDRRLVVERGADQRRRADQVAGADGDAAPALALASARSFLTVVVRYSTPPAGVPLTRRAVPVGGSMAPWKSLKASRLPSAALAPCD